MPVAVNPIERPTREPFFTEGHPFHPSFALAFGHERTFWPPTETEPGQERFTIVTHTFNQKELAADFMPLERLAKFGMRPVFEEVGLYSSYTIHEDADTYAMPVSVYEAVLAFHGTTRFVESFNSLTAGMPPDTRFTAEACAPGRFKSSDWVPSLARKKFMIPSEGTPYKKALADHFNHDLRAHIPAWLSMPPIVTTAIHQKAISLTETYLVALEDMHKDPDLRANPQADLQALESAKTNMSAFTGEMEIMHVNQLDHLIQGRDKEEKLTAFLAQLLSGTRDMYKEAILEHAANPRPQDLLVAVTT